MRDQFSATTAATTVNVLDFLNDENAEITLEKLVKAVAKITQPSSEIINETLESGTNTSKFLHLLDHLQTANEAQKAAAMKGTLKAIHEMSKVNSVHRKAIAEAQAESKGKDHNDDLDKTNEAVYATLKTNQRKKGKLWVSYGKCAEEAGEHIDTLTKVARSLFQLQESSGMAIRSDKTALMKFTIAIKLLDGQWTDLRRNFALMEVCKAEIEEAESMRGIVKVEVRDVETGEVKVVEQALEGLSLEFLEGREEDACDEEEEESDDERVVDLDVESGGEEEEVAPGVLLEGENGVVEAGEDENN